MPDTVQIFGKEGWPYTREAREAYAAKGIQVEYFDVKSTPSFLAKMLSHTNGQRRVPVIVEGGRVTIGYGGT